MASIKEPAVGARPRLMDKARAAQARGQRDWECGCGQGPHRYYLTRCPNMDCRAKRP
jgi:hypothetical protein